MQLASGLHPDVLYHPVAVSALSIAGDLLQRTDQAAAAIGPGAESEALHDFRVALRRLRSFINAYRKVLPVGATQRKAMSRLAAQTNTARDEEVMLAWVNQYLAHHHTAAAALTSLQVRITHQAAAHYGSVDVVVSTTWPALHRELEYALVQNRRSRSTANFAGYTARLLTRGLRRLERLTPPEASDATASQLHRLRVQLKKLRYLLEPLAHLLETEFPLVAPLKAAQEGLGDYHDLAVIGARLPDYIEAEMADHVRRYLRRPEGLHPLPTARTLHEVDPLPHLLRLLHAVETGFNESAAWCHGTFLVNDLPEIHIQLTRLVDHLSRL